jgi:hypothetical protein
MAGLDHEHIVQFIGICMRDGEPNIVTIWRPHGPLDLFLQNQKGLKPVHLLTYCRQIAEVILTFWNGRFAPGGSSDLRESGRNYTHSKAREKLSLKYHNHFT